MRPRLALAIPAAAAAALAVTAAPAPAATVTYTCTPAPADCSGWYRTPVHLAWSVPAGYDTEGCDNRTYDTDTPGTDNRCRATGGSAVEDITVTIRVDRTPPTVTGAGTARPPDAAGWFTHPVGVTFTGTDATSGLAGCTALTYAGPDAADAAVTGTCTDVAGNVSAPFGLALRYDATPPALTLRATPGDRRAALRWTASADTAGVTLERLRPGPRTIFRGTGHRFTDRHVANGRRYVYRLTARDAAGNTGTAQIAVRPGRRLLTPADRARVAAPPVLRWTAVRGARYYNVQLFRQGRKVLSAWPRHARLALHGRWRYAGRHRRLRPGRYVWYVWPGRGARRDRRFGPLIGRRTFRVG